MTLVIVVNDSKEGGLRVIVWLLWSEQMVYIILCGKNLLKPKRIKNVLRVEFANIFKFTEDGVVLICEVCTV